MGCKTCIGAVRCLEVHLQEEHVVLESSLSPYTAVPISSSGVVPGGDIPFVQPPGRLLPSRHEPIPRRRTRTGGRRAARSSRLL